MNNPGPSEAEREFFYEQCLALPVGREKSHPAMPFTVCRWDSDWWCCMNDPRPGQVLALEFDDDAQLKNFIMKRKYRAKGITA